MKAEQSSACGVAASDISINEGGVVAAASGRGMRGSKNAWQIAEHQNKA